MKRGKKNLTFIKEQTSAMKRFCSTFPCHLSCRNNLGEFQKNIVPASSNMQNQLQLIEFRSQESYGGGGGWGSPEYTVSLILLGRI